MCFLESPNFNINRLLEVILWLNKPVLQRRSKLLDPCQGLPKGKCRFVGEGKAYASAQWGQIFCEVIFLHIKRFSRYTYFGKNYTA